MSKEWILYIARAADALGNWITFLAVALFVNENFGADKVAYAFLISSMPALVLSKNAFNAIPLRFQKKTYFSGLLLMSINVLLLIRANSIWHVYFYLFIASCISAYLRPLLDSLTADAFEKSQLDRILTRVGSLTTSILCIAPPLGASLATSMGYSVVYILDAATFIISGTLLFFVFKGSKNNREITENAYEMLKSQTFALKELQYPKPLRSSLFFWYLVLVLGALINSGEFGLFTSASYTKPEIGYVVACWGIGGLIAFLTANMSFKDHLRTMFVLYGSLLATFFLFPHFWISCFIFIGSGMLSAKLGGKMRATIQSNIPDNMRSLEVWGLVNSRLSLINMLIYGSIGFLIPYWGVTWVFIPLSVVTIIGPLILKSKNIAV